MELLSGAFVFILGSIVGSFLNVLIFRYNADFFSNKRSVCFSCNHTLKPLDLIPIGSFLFLGGRCRYCKSRISFQYPLVEFFTALIYLLIYLRLGGFGLEILFYWIVWSLLIAIFVYDLRHKIIPNGLVYILITLTLAKVLLNIFIGTDLNIIWPILSGPIAASPLALLWLVSRGRWMGFGDVKLMLSIGFLLGILGSISALVFAFWIGAVTGIFLIAFSKFKLFMLSGKFKSLTIKSEIPFAPFIIIGAAAVFLGGIDILSISFY